MHNLGRKLFEAFLAAALVAVVVVASATPAEAQPPDEPSSGCGFTFLTTKSDGPANDCDNPPLSCGFTFLTAGRCAEEVRREAIDEMIDALESYGDEHGTYVVAGGGTGGNGQGWAFWEDDHITSTANVLIEAGHLSPSPLHDPLWTDHTSIAGDVLIYVCRDRVAVFSREGSGDPSAEDRNWWDTTGCNRYPIDRLGISYFALSESLTPEEPRREAIDELIGALESYGDEHGTYVVAGGGTGGNGQGWVFWEDDHITSTANVLIEAGHLSSSPLHDSVWIDDTSIVGDVLIYVCKDRVAVFSREGYGEPSAEDRNWWDTNGCNRYPIDRLGVTYFALSARL